MNVFEPIYSTVPTVWEALLCFAIIIAFSLIFAYLYARFKEMDGYHKDTPVTLIILPLVVCGLVIGVNTIVYNFTGSDDIARYARAASALLSAVLILKIRSYQRTPEDLAYYLFLIGLSLLVGLGYVLYGLILFAITLMVFIIINVLHFPRLSKNRYSLKITVPEDLNYDGAFDEVLNKYCQKYQLKMVKSGDLGTIFVLQYEIILKADINQKEMLDEIRTRNANLDVSLVSGLFATKEV